MSSDAEFEIADAEDLSTVIGLDDCVRLYGNLYRVRRSRIEYADPGITVEDGQIKFGNPRWVRNGKGKSVARGLEPTRMAELRESIQNEGLENPLRLRLVENEDGCVLQLVNGERRFRSIDLLVAEQAVCVDPATNIKLPADDLYEWVDCRINRMSEKDALRLAFRPNETGESIGEYAAIEIVRALRQTGSTDQEILNITGMSITWLRDTDRLLSLDNKTVAAFQTDGINRRLALKLAAINDVDERLQRLEQCCTSAVERLAERAAALKEAVAKDEQAAEISEAVAALAERDGDEEEAKEMRQRGKKSQQRANKRKERIQELENAPATATSKDWDRTASDDDPPKPLTVSKIDKFWRIPLGRVVHNKTDDEGNEPDYDLEDARLMKAVCDAIVEGKREGNSPVPFDKILRQHKRAKDRRVEQ